MCDRCDYMRGLRWCQTPTPLTDATIQSLLLFAFEFHERLAEVERTSEGRRVIDGLDVTVTVVWKDGEIYLKLRSILRPHGMTISLLPQSHSWVDSGDPLASKDRACVR